MAGPARRPADARAVARRTPASPVVAGSAFPRTTTRVVSGGDDRGVVRTARRRARVPPYSPGGRRRVAGWWTTTRTGVGHDRGNPSHAIRIRSLFPVLTEWSATVRKL